MTLIQFLIIGLAILVLFRTILAFKKKRIPLKMFIFWVGLWIVVIVLAILPQITAPLSKILGVGRGADLAIYLSILLLFFLLYKIIVRLERIEHDITAIIKEIALRSKKD